VTSTLGNVRFCPMAVVEPGGAVARAANVRFRPEADIALLFSAMAQRRLVCAGTQRPEI